VDTWNKIPFFDIRNNCTAKVERQVY